MLDPRQARLLAPAGLVVFAIAFFAVLVTSDRSPGGDRATTTARPAQRGKPPPRPRRTYRVRPGDTLGAISERTNVSSQRLQELNPSLDPQLLVPGQRLKLRP
jgi:LysM repeat protein